MPVHAGALDGVLFCGAYKQAHKTVPAQKRVAAAFRVMTVMINFAHANGDCNCLNCQGRFINTMWADEGTISCNVSLFFAGLEKGRVKVD